MEASSVEVSAVVAAVVAAAVAAAVWVVVSLSPLESPFITRECEIGVLGIEVSVLVLSSLSR